MASIKNLKKDIDYVLGDVLDVCLTNLTADTKKTEALVEEIYATFDELVAKVNAKNIENKKAHFNGIKAELEASAGKLLEKAIKL